MAKQSPRTTAKKTTSKKANTRGTKSANRTAAKSVTKDTTAAAATTPETRSRRFGNLKGRVKLRRGNLAAMRTRSSKTERVIGASSLNTLHKILGVLLLLEAIALLVLSTKALVPVTINYLALDTLASQGGEGNVLSTAVRHLFDVNIAYLTAAMLLTFAVSHLLAATALRKKFEGSLNAKANRGRWLTYAIGFSLAVVLIALLSGIRDLQSLLLIVVLLCVGYALSAVTELNGYVRSRASYIIGQVAFVTVWLVILLYLVAAAINDGHVPAYIFPWLFLTSALLIAEVTNPYRFKQQADVGTNYLAAERRYMIMSFIAVTAIAAQVFAGTLR
jgi:hypothetical protein